MEITSPLKLRNTSYFHRGIKAEGEEEGDDEATFFFFFDRNDEAT